MWRVICLFALVQTGIPLFATQSPSLACETLLAALDAAVSETASSSLVQQRVAQRLGEMLKRSGAHPEIEREPLLPSEVFKLAPRLNVAKLLREAMQAAGYTTPASRARWMRSTFWSQESADEMGRHMRQALLNQVAMPSLMGSTQNLASARRMGVRDLGAFSQFMSQASPSLFSAWLREELNGRSGEVSVVRSPSTIASAIGVPADSLLVRSIRVPPVQSVFESSEDKRLYNTGVIDLALHSTLRANGLQGRRALQKTLESVLASEATIEALVHETVARLQYLSENPQNASRLLSNEVLTALGAFRGGKGAEALSRVVLARLLLSSPDELAGDLRQQTTLIRVCSFETARDTFGALADFGGYGPTVSGLVAAPSLWGGGFVGSNLAYYGTEYFTQMESFGAGFAGGVVGVAAGAATGYAALKWAHARLVAAHRDVSYREVVAYLSEKGIRTEPRNLRELLGAGAVSMEENATDVEDELLRSASAEQQEPGSEAQDGLRE